MWKIGPECAAQQQKCASARVMNCGVLNACATLHSISGTAAPPVLEGAAGCGAGRTRNEAGISSAEATVPITSIAVRQSYVVISQLANGATVSGATPMPADTRETAR